MKTVDYQAVEYLPSYSKATELAFINPGNAYLFYNAYTNDVRAVWYGESNPSKTAYFIVALPWKVEHGQKEIQPTN